MNDVYVITFIQIPEEKEFAPACSCGADMTEQVNTWVPEHTVKTQHHLKTDKHTMTPYFSLKLNNNLMFRLHLGSHVSARAPPAGDTAVLAVQVA